MQVVDPIVSRRKFADELEQFRGANRVQRGRGIFLLQAVFPDMDFLFTIPQLSPLTVLFSVRINFDNYDLEPLSVRFTHPLTGEYLLLASVPLYRKIEHPDRPPELQPLVQKDATGLPFICMPGIREYHAHPAHTGDAWLRHRGIAGEGTLGFVLDKLYDYGIVPVTAFQGMFQAPALSISLDLNLIST
jgi:hypothetical protein